MTTKRKRATTADAEFARAVTRAMRRAARAARRTARMHGTPIYVMRNGKVVAVKP
jgi:hypothetical protein